MSVMKKSNRCCQVYFPLSFSFSFSLGNELTFLFCLIPNFTSIIFPLSLSLFLSVLRFKRENIDFVFLGGMGGMHMQALDIACTAVSQKGVLPLGDWPCGFTLIQIKVYLELETVSASPTGLVALFSLTCWSQAGVIGPNKI